MSPQHNDSRNLFTGTIILRSGYLDQPYCDVIHATGRWVCTITQGAGAEGSSGEHVAALWSDDEGASWSAPIAVEPSPIGMQLPNAYSMTLVAPSLGDRVYTIYNMNLANITHDGPHGKPITRTDMMGGFFMRYSDDGGASWSKTRYKVPYRLTSIDKHNEWGGNTTINWSVDQLKVRDGVAYFAFTKIGKYLLGPPESMWVMKSPNLLSESDASRVTWELLPGGDDGIVPMIGDEGTHLEEAHVLPLTGAGYPGFYVAGRTTVGWIVESSTADKTGVSGWAASRHAQYLDPRIAAKGPFYWAPLGDSGYPFGGARAGLKNPRGPITMKRFDGPSGAPSGHGTYLLLFYNNHVKTYLSRDPYWLCAGWEVGARDGKPPTVLWSQPEVVLYDRDDHTNRPGYPDFVSHYSQSDQAWDIFITETQKTEARLHKIDRRLLAGLWAQHNASGFPSGEVLRFGSTQKTVPTPPLPAFDGTDAAASGVGGLGLALILTLEKHEQSAAGEILLSSEESGRGGVAVLVGPAAGGQLTLRLSDGARSFNASTDDACSAALGSPGRHVFGVVADGGPRLVSLLVDGVLCDGAGTRDYGWAWFSALGSVRGAEQLALTPDYGGHVVDGRVYDRMLTTSEMVAAARAVL